MTVIYDSIRYLVNIKAGKSGKANNAVAAIKQLGKATYQDNKNWFPGSSNFNNGRLQVSRRFRVQHKLDATQVSYEHTKNLISAIFNHNAKLH